jgi:NAD(P)-dependent dehydrogenase (short-subunit alcohol dehydrogenase family)
VATLLITGCSNGFGRLAAHELSAAGHTVLATMRVPRGRNSAAASELEKLPNVRVLELDVTDDKSVQEAADLADDVDVVIHNAGIGATGVTEAGTAEQLSYIMEVNLIGVHRLNRAILPKLRARGNGLLIYLSSGLGRTVLPYMSAYCASKYALEAYAESLSYELTPHGIDTVILQPGAYPTGFRTSILTPDDVPRLADYPVEQKESETIHRNISEMLHSEMAPDPRDVTNAMLKVIDMPRGERPLRVALRRDAGGLKMINQICGEVQGALLRGMNLEYRAPKRPQL